MRVRRPGEAIDATMFATAIGVDRTVEGNVRRVVEGDDLAGLLLLDFGAQGRQFLDRVPAVVLDEARQPLEAPTGIGAGAASPPPLDVDNGRAHRHRIGERDLAYRHAHGRLRESNFSVLIRTKREHSGKRNQNANHLSRIAPSRPSRRAVVHDMRTFEKSDRSSRTRLLMISVVIAANGQEVALAETLAALVPAAADGFVREVVVVAESGPSQGTRLVADAVGCVIVEGDARAGLEAAAATGCW